MLNVTQGVDLKYFGNHPILQHKRAGSPKHLFGRWQGRWVASPLLPRISCCRFLVSPSQTAIYVKCHTVHDTFSIFTLPIALRFSIAEGADVPQRYLCFVCELFTLLPFPILESTRAK